MSIPSLLHSLSPFYPMFSSNPTCPSAPPSSFYPLILFHTLTSPLLFQFFSKLPFHSPSNTIFHFYKLIALLILRNFDELSLFVGHACFFFFFFCIYVCVYDGYLFFAVWITIVKILNPCEVSSLLFCQCT